MNKFVAAFVTALVATAVSSTAVAQEKVILGISGWTGFAPLSLADKAGIFKKNGVDVEIRFIAPVQRSAALASGALNAAATTVDQHLVWTSAGVPAVQVLLIDKSNGGDGLVVRNGINSVKDLKGKTVAVDGPGTVQHFMLSYVLQKNGMTMQDVGAALTASLGGGYVNYFSLSGRSYKVIPQVLQVDRLNPAQLDNYYIRTPKGDLIPASTVAHIVIAAEPESINRFQQLNSATISGVLAPGVTLGDAMDALTAALQQAAPSGYSIDSAGQLRQYVQESGGFVVTLIFAIIIVFLVLAAQFESFRDSVVILASVPMAAFGALLCLNAGFATMNIYTQVGLVTLIGLISKHGILIVQFANDLQRDGMKKREAIEEAAAVRLRPILMTTAAMLLGVVPLVLASGAGAVGRNNMGLIIFSGISVGTLFTLFVVPAMYMLLAVQHRARTEEEPGQGGSHALTVTGNHPPPAPTV
ncbi:MAG: efflux RND transporter permease subunit [Alphaproteobacteria bacterium]|nr:efflux RND transporter permease subunit [Alphaproteobacteria bacterium]